MGRRKGTTAFPIARIKKIMQSDDDVGKIATNTPALVGKALECLMEDLLRDSAAVALQRRAKTLTPSYIKATVATRAQFDFLRPLLANVPDIADTLDTKPKRPRSTVPPLATDAPPLVLKRRKPAASPVAVAAVAQDYNTQHPPAPVVVPETTIDRMRDDDDDDYDDDEFTPPCKIDLPSTPTEVPTTPLASPTDIPETPVVIRDFGVVHSSQQRKSPGDTNQSSRARVSVHALLS